MTTTLHAPQLPIRHAYTTVRGLRLHYAETGRPDGPPVLFVHGFPLQWQSWLRLLPALAEDHRLICLDMPGFGLSEGAAEGSGRYSTDERVADLVAFLDALDLPAVRLVAHDMGAWTGFFACLRSPERFSHLLALNVAHPWPVRRNTLRNAWRWWFTAAWEWPPVGRAVLRHWPAFTRFILRYSVADRATWAADEVAQYAQAARVPAAARAGEGLNWQFVINDIRSMRRKEFDRLRLTTPTVLLVGGRDPIVPPVMAEGGHEHAEDLRVITVPDAGHQLAEERPEAVAAAARELFAR
jgi:pimeloyl-ACP methyl ester carboxylesterase